MTAVLGSSDRAVLHRRGGGTSVTHSLLDVLAAWGVRRIYCCPGSTEAAVLDALVTRDDVELMLVTHESVAVAMAEGDARAAGRPAVAGLLGGARRPVLVAGGEVARRHAAERVAALAERLGAPVFDEGRRDFLASGVPTAHPLHAGLYDPAHPAVQDADVVAFLGGRLFTEFEGGPSADLPASARLLHLHPDPMEPGRLHPVDAPLTGDLALALDDLLAALPPASQAAPVPYSPAKGPGGPTAGPGCYPGHRGLGPVVEVLAAAVEEAAATVILDATTATVPLLRGLRTTRPGQLLSSTSGSLGWGMGSALGVALADSGYPVVALLGDGAFQFGLPALWTARRYQVPVTFVVLNNRTYSAVASALNRFGGAAAAQDRWPGTDIAGLDIAAAGRAFGLPAEQVTGGERLAEALAAALGSRGPSVLEIITGPEQPPAPDSAANPQEAV